MDAAHELILVGGALGLLSILAGAVSSRFNAPLLLVFLLLGMLAGEDGPGGIVFADFRAAYLIGSVALAVILFDGGLNTAPATIKAAFWPALALATAGVALTAAIVAVAAVLLLDVPWSAGLLVGAILAPTDAAAVNTLLRATKVAIPERVTAALEIESGLNDPMSVFLTIVLVEILTGPGGVTTLHAASLFAEEMLGGAAIGVGAGYALLWLLRRLPVETPVYPVLAIAAVLTVFGGAQTVGASGFLAVYLMGVIVRVNQFEARRALVFASGAFAWLAQIALFLMLGLLVTPHQLLAVAGPIAAIAAVLILVARPVATFLCLLPFGYSGREAAFASWVGLRGAVPIYLAIIPVLAGEHNSAILFGGTFGVVITSLVVQGWTISPVARLLGFRAEERVAGGSQEG